MKRRTILKSIFFTLGYSVLHKLSGGRLWARSWDADLHLHLLRAQSESAIDKFCKEYSWLKSCKAYMTQKKEKSYSQMQADSSFDWINDAISFGESVIAELPPVPENLQIRKGAFQILDYPLYANASGEKASAQYKDAWHDALKANYANRIDKIISELVQPVKAGELAVWKLYNCGFVCKTSAGCVAIDLRPQYPLDFTQAQLDELAKNLDVLVISHPHFDHFDISLIEAMAKLGKPVYTPNPSLVVRVAKGYVERFNLNKTITFDEQKYPSFQSLYKYGEAVGTKIGGIEIISYGGVQHKKETPNSVHVVKMGGFTIQHCGDNQASAKNRVEDLYDMIAQAHKVDVSFVNIWSGFVANVLRSKPQLVIPMHENELHHAPLGRVQYRWAWKMYENLKSHGVDVPFIQLANGEKFIYKKG